MHLMLSCDALHLPAEVLNELPKLFGSHPHHSPFPGTWVVQVPGFAYYEKLHQGLQEEAQRLEARHGVPLRFLLSPLIHSGSYRGRISAESASHIPELTEPV